MRDLTRDHVTLTGVSSTSSSLSPPRWRYLPGTKPAVRRRVLALVAGVVTPRPAGVFAALVGVTPDLRGRPTGRLGPLYGFFASTGETTQTQVFAMRDRGLLAFQFGSGKQKFHCTETRLFGDAKPATRQNQHAQRRDTKQNAPHTGVQSYASQGHVIRFFAQ